MVAVFIFLIVVIILVIIFVGGKSNSTGNRTIEEYKNKIKELNLNYEIKKGNEYYDLEIQNENNHFLVKFLSIPNYAEIQVNNKYTYEVKYGAGNNPGKAQPYSKYLNNVRGLVNYEAGNDVIKIFVITPKPKKIVKWINECEIIFVDYKTDVWGMRVIGINDFNIYKEN